MDNAMMDLYGSTPMLSPASPSLFTCLDEGLDFTLGAKCSPFLLPATTTTTTASYDLPEWMEGREIVGLPPRDSLPPYAVLPPTTTASIDSHILPDETYCQTIKPEDMLVPLSEYHPPHTPTDTTTPTTPPQYQSTADDFILSDHEAIVTPLKLTATTTATTTAATNHYTATSKSAITPKFEPIASTTTTTTTTATAAAAITLPTTPSLLVTYPSPPHTPSPPPPPPQAPRIIICRKVTAQPIKRPKPIKIKFQLTPKPKAQSELYREIVGNESDRDLSLVPCSDRTREPAAADQDLTADELIDDLVRMIHEDDLQGLDHLDVLPFDAEEMETCMEDLLTQLEATDHPQRIEELPSKRSVETISHEPIQNVIQQATDEHEHTNQQPKRSVETPAHETTVNFPLTPTDQHTPIRDTHSPPPETYQSVSPSPSPSLRSYTSSPILPSPVPTVGSLSACESESFSLDEDWSPLEEAHSYSKTVKSRTRGSRSSRRSRPYPQDRKERKKEQNKQAALRYRQKKKQEEDEVGERIRLEEERQQELRLKYDALKQELGYLKKMMREMFLARGVLTEKALQKAAKERKAKK